MKKTIVILFFIILCCICVVSLTSCNTAKKMNFAFVTDTHVVANNIYTAENYSSYTSIDKMIHLSEAILNTTADEIIKNKTKFLLLGGDLTESGDLQSHKSIITTLNRLKKAGVSAFVINGNHDISQNASQTSKIYASDFSELYSDFGYGDALSLYDGTLSYTADIDNNYRLIALDNVSYTTKKGVYKEDFNSQHADWALTQVDACIADKRTPIIIAHKPFIQHMPKITEPFIERSYYNISKRFLESLADKGCNYSFTGHMHMQDAKSLTTKNDNVFTDIETSSTVFYPSAYRNVSFTKDKVDITTKKIGNLNSDYLSPFSPEDEKLAVTTNFSDYSYNHLSGAIKMIVGSATKPYGMIGSKQFNGDMGKLMDILLPNVLDKMLNNPLYIKDENDNISLERILSGYDIALPESTYYSIADMTPFFVANLMGGDENIKDCKENYLLKQAVNSLFYYLNIESDNIKTAFPDTDKINIDLDKLFTQGVLECYDSNLIPAIIDILSTSIDSDIVINVLQSIATDFSALPSYQQLINIYTNGHLSGVTTYFTTTEINLQQLLDDLFIVYLSDYIYNESASDNSLVIDRSID